MFVRMDRSSHWLPVALFLSSLVLPDSGAEAALPKSTREIFQRNAQLAPYVLVVEVEETRCFVNRGFPWQRVTARVLESIKGPYAACASVEFGFPARICDGVDRIPQYPFEMQPSDSFFVVLTNCGEFPLPRPASTRLIGRVHGQSVTFAIPDTTLNLTAVLDSMRTLVSHCDPAWLSRNSDAVISAKIISTDVMWPLDARHTKGEIRVVPEVVHGTSRAARITIGQSLTVTLATWQPPSRNAFGQPILTADSSVILFLRATDGGQWELLPTVYSGWTVDGDYARVLGVSPVCGTSDARVIETRTLTDLQQRIGW